MTTNEAEITTWTANLDSDDWTIRHSAREALERAGSDAVPAVSAILRDGAPRARWEAARILSGTADARAVEPLVAALEDEEGGIRWLAAEGLIHIGDPSVIPVLRRLLLDAESPWLREGAHRVLRSLARPETTPVTDVLLDTFAPEKLPVEVDRALRALERR